MKNRGAKKAEANFKGAWGTEGEGLSHTVTWRSEDTVLLKSTNSRTYQRGKRKNWISHRGKRREKEWENTDKR